MNIDEKNSVVEDFTLLQSLLGEGGLATALASFFQESEVLHSQIQAILFSGGEKEQLFQLLHKLHGILAAVMAFQCEELLAQIETVAKQGELDRARTLYSSFSERLNEFTNSAQEHLKSLSQ